jgi:hypothetical protein
MTRPFTHAYIACSLDGWIARPDGSLDWLTGLPGPEGEARRPAMTRSPGTPVLALCLSMAAVSLPSVAQSRTGCFTLVTGDPAGWGGLQQVCPVIDRPRDPRPVRLR